MINSRYFNSCFVGFLLNDVMPVLQTDTDLIHREDPKDFHLGSFGGVKGHEVRTDLTKEKFLDTNGH